MGNYNSQCFLGFFFRDCFRFGSLHVSSLSSTLSFLLAPLQLPVIVANLRELATRKVCEAVIA